METLHFHRARSWLGGKSVFIAFGRLRYDEILYTAHELREWSWLQFLATSVPLRRVNEHANWFGCCCLTIVKNQQWWRTVQRPSWKYFCKLWTRRKAVSCVWAGPSPDTRGSTLLLLRCPSYCSRLCSSAEYSSNELGNCEALLKVATRKLIKAEAILITALLFLCCGLYPHS